MLPNEKEPYQEESAIFLEKGNIGRKGQMTLFIIIGIILMIAGTYYLLVSEGRVLGPPRETEDLTILSGNAQSAKSYANSCLEKASIESISSLAMHGGYFDAPPLFANYYWEKIPLYYSSGANHSPSLDEMAQHLSEIIGSEFASCLENASEMALFSKREGPFPVEVGIGKHGIGVGIRSEIAIDMVEGGSMDISPLSYSSSARLLELYGASQEILFAHMENISRICLSCISDIAERHGFLIEIDDQDEGWVAYTIHSNSSDRLGNISYIFAAEAG